MGTLAASVLKLVLLSVHSALWLQHWLYVNCEWCWIYLFNFTSAKHYGTELEGITNDAKRLEKVPQHLALLVQEEQISCDDLARLAVWSFASGIKTLSLYDSHGRHC